MARTHGNRQKHETANPIQRRLIDGFHGQVIRLVNELAPASILEVGCGEGFVLSALRQAGVSAELTGIDLSASAIADARACLGDEADVRVEDAHDLAQLTSTYDLVMMLEVLEHLEQPSDMLPVLGGLANQSVLMSVPREPWFRGLNFLRLKNVSHWGNDPEHINHWSKRGFREFVGEYLDVREVASPFPWTLVLATPRP